MSRRTVQAADKRPFAKKLMSLTGKHQLWQVWQDFITIVACAISIPLDPRPDRIEMHKRLLDKYDASEKMVLAEALTDLINALEENPEQDFLGSAYMELELGNHWIGQFFTPYCLCQMMAEISCEDVVDQIEKKGYASINDCACGAGATLIAGIHAVRKNLEKAESPLNWQNHLLVVGQDLDMVTGLMCYIQLSLLGAAGYVKIGNTLTDPIHAGDSTENYWYTPMYHSDVWRGRRLWHNIDRIFNFTPAKTDLADSYTPTKRAKCTTPSR